jgi:hypothetical protein
VFLCVGGEGPALRATVVTIGDAHCALAVETARRRNALVVALEHRFYGASQVRANASLRANVALLVFFTHQLGSTFDRVPFRLTDEDVFTDSSTSLRDPPRSPPETCRRRRSGGTSRRRKRSGTSRTS